MPTKLRAPEPGIVISHGIEHFKADSKGIVEVPDSAVASLVESHGFVDPSKEHPYGLKLVKVKGGFHVVDKDSVPVHGGVLPAGAAYAVLNSWTPSAAPDKTA